MKKKEWKPERMKKKTNEWEKGCKKSHTFKTKD